MFSWSNPDQSDLTAAKLQGSFQPQQVQIGSIVAALLKQKHDDEALKQQQTQDLIKGIGSAAIGYEKGQQAGAADDSANAAMYGMQNPGDPYGGYTDPNRVPDYGGTDSLKDYLLAKKADTNDPMSDYVKAQQGNAAMALANQRWSNPNGFPGRGNNGVPTQNQQWEQYQRELGRQGKALSNELGDVPIGQAANDNAYSTVTDFGGPSLLTRIGPPRFSHYKDPNSGKDVATPDYSNVYPNTDADRLESAAQAYQNALKTPQPQAQQGAAAVDDYGQTIPGATPSSVTSNRPGAGPVQPSISQNDVNQAQQATGSGDMVRVRAPNGQTGSIPRANLPDAIKVGYTPL